MKKETHELIKENVIIHGVFGDATDYMSAHTHGAKELIGYEVEFVLPLEKTIIMNIINHTIGELYDNNISMEFNKPIENNFLNCPIQLMECDFGEKDKTIRILVPDNEGNFPDTSTSAVYKKQATINTVASGYRYGE